MNIKGGWTSLSFPECLMVCVASCIFLFPGVFQPLTNTLSETERFAIFLPLLIIPGYIHVRTTVITNKITFLN